MTLKDLLPTLSLIAERHLARARATLEGLGIDTTAMLPAEILDRVKHANEPTADRADGSAHERGERREVRPVRDRSEMRGHRVWRYDWRRRSGLRTRNAKRLKHSEQT